MKCIKCAAQIQDASQFCPQCGSAVTQTSEKLTTIKGNVLDYDWRNSSGFITGDDGFRYGFAIADWNSDQVPSKGAAVDFIAEEGNAKQIFLVAGSAGSSGSESVDSKKLVCGILAILLGCFGIHKFYLNSISKSSNYTTSAVILLIAGTVGWVLILPAIISIIIGIVEGVIYLTMSGDKFQETYITEKRNWF